MKWHFRKFDAAGKRRDEILDRLRSIFHDILLRVGGDAEEAMEWMGILGARHDLFSDGVSMEEFAKWLEQEAKEVGRIQGRLQLSKRGERTIRDESLEQVFEGLSLDVGGEHGTAHAGTGTERLPETRPWSFGDGADSIAAGPSLRNAMLRSGWDRDAPLQMSEADLEVYETEHRSSCATVLLVDISHSMILYGEDRITPAKRTAIALCELIRTRFPKDYLGVVTFGDEAREVPLDSLPYIEVGPFHTNTRGALIMAEELLRRRGQANRQVFMITDGKPSALTERDGTIYKNPFGLDRRVRAKTLEKAASFRRLGIPISTFMLTEDPMLVSFVEEFTELNQGRAYFTGLQNLGGTLFVDYLRNRRRSVS